VIRTIRVPLNVIRTIRVPLKRDPRDPRPVET
jgi:hypothetical protein